LHIKVPSCSDSYFVYGKIAKQAVSELTTQLEQARQQVAEKEAESRAWEDRAINLSQQLKTARMKYAQLTLLALSLLFMP